MPIYLDNAATSFPKPESVYAAIDRANRQLAVSAGRGRYQRANDVARLIEQTRTAVAAKIGSSGSKNISFAFSGTDALSTAILGFVRPGDHVVSSIADHTSVLRPLWHLQANQNVSLSLLRCDEHGIIDADAFAKTVSEQTRLVCLSHASNVTGVIQPIKSIAEICRSKGVALLVDAAQTIGHLDCDVTELGCDFLAAPGHKGLMGPLGTAFLYVSDRVANETQPLRFGGTGSTGSDPQQPTACPQKFESGNQNVPGIAGLLAGLQWMDREHNSAAEKRLAEHAHALASGLRTINGVIVYGDPETQITPTVSFNIQSMDCQTTGLLLDSQFEIECRTGLHCAPLIHESIGSYEFGGTIRFSPGPFTTSDEIETAIDAVRQIAS